MCVACNSGVPACAISGPCLTIAQQAVQYAAIIGIIGLGTTRLFFRGIYDRVIGAFTRFAYARYEQGSRS